MKLENKTIGGERELYECADVLATDCKFEGGDALWRCLFVNAENCTFGAPRPLWQCREAELKNCKVTQDAREAFWYAKDISVLNSNIIGYGAFRECKNVVVKECEVSSDEFGWNTDGARITDSKISGGYFLLSSKNIAARRIDIKGKYAMQYMDGGIVMDSKIDTVSALWHSKGVTLENCVIIGEYFGWHSVGLTLKNCTIVGAQPLCFCKKLHLIDCVMQNTDNAFEGSEVYAVLRAELKHVKNPYKGVIKAPTVGEIIRTDKDAKCKVLTDPALMRGANKDNERL